MSVAYEPVIGLEVHAQLMSASKLFSWAGTAYGAPPNTNITPVCLGLPGSLPVPNRQAVRLAVRAALALGLTVQEESRFDRKHYFYPDLPKGYQISQFDRPIALEGKVTVDVEGAAKTIRIQRIHMEEDAAKNIHDTHSVNTQIDFNRAGVPLIEIVTHPDLRSSAEAEAYLRALHEVLVAVKVNDGNLEEGSFRCDANVSIRPVGQEKFGTRVELKNINSFRFVRKAIDYEIARQEAVLRGGGTVVQETRLWNEPQGKTMSMRGKEEAHDYRYFPDPDLPPLIVTKAEIEEIRAELPELPEARRARWVSTFGLTEYDAQVLSGNAVAADVFDHVTKTTPTKEAGKRASNFIQSEVLRLVSASAFGNASAASIGDRVLEVFALVDAGTVSASVGKAVFGHMAESPGKSAADIVKEKGLAQVVDVGAIEAAVKAVIDASPSQVAQYKGGKTMILGYFVGQVMKATKGTANPQLVNELVKKLLDG